MAQALKVIADFYDFMLWLIRHTEKFPRHHRYSLGLAVENRLQTILALLLRAKYSKDKAEPLNNANLELEVLRFQVRLAEDLKALPVKSQRQQQRSSACPALPVDALRQARNRLIQGSAGCGLESPGPAPVPSGGFEAGGRIHVVRLDGSGRRCAERPIRPLMALEARNGMVRINLWRWTRCAA